MNSKLVLFVLTLSILLITHSYGYAEVTNKFCPVTTDELAEVNFSLKYEGQTIYFCCKGCIKDFLANPKSYLSNLKTNANEKIAEPHDQATHEHGKNNSHESQETSSGIKDISATTNNENNHEHNDEATHDHATDHEQSSSLLTFIGKFHPLVIHFPIALVLTAFLFTGLSIFFKVDTFDTFSIYLIYIASLTAIISAVFGYIAGESASYPSFLTSTLEWHRILGISSAIATLITAYLGYRKLSQNKVDGFLYYRLLLTVNVILVGITGHLGATLVYGLDYFKF